MPAVSKKQLRYAYAHRNEKWARELIENTPSTKGLPMRKKRRGK
jgi:hypothetical protein